VSLATPLLLGRYWHRWFDWPQILFTSQVPLLTAITAYALFRSLGNKARYLPFILSLGLFLLGMIGLGISMWPYVVPDRVTIWDAAAPHSSQLFMLVGTVVIIPTILAYTAFAYWVFRGKVGTEGYH
jgi:cytochrome d ubiquinol oxidase subunit II